MKATVRKLQQPPVTYTVREIPIARIRAFADQPRKWFNPEEITARAESMKALGQQDPVTVEPITGDPQHDYELINGESRLRSAREAGIATLWAAVRSVPFPSKVQKHLASLVANFNRSDHTPMEISDALHLQVTEGGLNQSEIARAVGQPPMWVSKYLSLRSLHPDIQAMLHPTVPRNERLSPTAAFELARLPLEKQLEAVRLARDIDGNRVTRRALRSAIEPAPQPVGEQQTVMDHWSPRPEHIAHLRAGIQAFRAALERRYGEGNPRRD